MPSKSGAQHRYMEMIAHGGKPRGGGGPSKTVAQHFVAADKSAGKHFAGKGKGHGLAIKSKKGKGS